MVCGSRDWSDAERIQSVLAGCACDPAGELIIGDAKGADAIARTVGAQLGFRVRVYEADWNRHGRRAGILRNIAMLDAEPRLVVAFWDGHSPGTRFSIVEARKRGISLQVEGA